MDISKLYFLPGSLRYTQQSDFPYLQLLKAALDSLGVVYPTPVSAAPTLDVVTTAGNVTSNPITVGPIASYPTPLSVTPSFRTKTDGTVEIPDLNLGRVALNLTPSSPITVGDIRWNDSYGTAEIRLKGNNVTLQVGQEQVKRVVNKTSPLITLQESAYQVVRIAGATGQRMSVRLAQANDETNSASTLGVVTETIAQNQEGFITTSGEVNGINTTGALQGETWADGDILYLSPDIAGELTNVKPEAPNHSVIVGYVEYAHANNGKIFVKVDNGYELGELHNVYTPSPINGDSIFWNTATNRYENSTIAEILGYTPANGNLYTTNGIMTGTRTVTMNQHYCSFQKIYSYVNNGMIPMGLQAYTQATYTGSSYQAGLHYGAGESLYESVFTGSSTLPNSIIDSSHHAARYLKLNTASSIISYLQGFSIRSAAVHTSQVAISSGTTSGTFSHVCNNQILAPYAAGTTGVTITNYYANLINDSSEYTSGGQLTITNRWAYYQAGANDYNFFNGPLMLGTNIYAGYKLDVVGATRIQGSLNLNGTIFTNTFNAGQINLSNSGEGNIVLSASNSQLGYIGNFKFGGNNNHPSAVVQIDNTSKGFLPPRMTGAQAEAISTPAEGLMVYATDGSGVTITSKGWWGFEGTVWTKLNT
jgi:hypothetical protein